MDDDDDYVDVDVDQIVQAHTARGAVQAGTQPNSSQQRTDVVAGTTGGPPRQGGTTGLIPPYSNPHQANANAPFAGPSTANPPYGAYSGQQPAHPQPSRLPQQQQPPPQQQHLQQPVAWTGAPPSTSGPPGSLFQHTAPRAAPGAMQQGRAPFGAGAPTGSGSSGGSAAAPPSVMPPPYSSATAPLQAATSAFTAHQQPDTGKPRSLGQQLGFGGGGPGGTGAAATTSFAGPPNGAAHGTYGGYGNGAPYGSSASAPYGVLASTSSHVTGAYGPSGSGLGARGPAPAGPGTWHATPGAAAPVPAGATAAAASTSATGAISAAGAASPTRGHLALPATCAMPPRAQPVASAVDAPSRDDAGGMAAATSAALAPLVAGPTAAAAAPSPAGHGFWGGAGVGAGLAPGAIADASRQCGGFGPGPGPGYGLPGAGGYGSQRGVSVLQQVPPAGGIGGGAAGPHGGPGGGGAHNSQSDVGTLRAHNSALEAQLESLKRQLEESCRMMKGAHSLQEQLQHAKTEAQELQRKNRETAMRLQEERTKGEAAEKEKKETHDKCLMLEAELHKARASSGGGSASRTPPAKQPGGGIGSGGIKRRHGLDPGHPLSGHMNPHGAPTQQLQQHYHYQQPYDDPMGDAGATSYQQRLNNQDPQQLATRGVVAAAGNAGQQKHRTAPGAERFLQQQQPGGGGSSATTQSGAATTAGTAANAARAAAEGRHGGSAAPAMPAASGTPSALLLAAIDSLNAARLPLWQRLWCTCGDSLTALLHPSFASAAAAAAAAAAGSAAGPGPGSLAAAAAAAAAGLTQLHNHDADHGLGELSQLSLSQAQSHGGGDMVAAAGGGVLQECVGKLEGVRVQLRALAAGRGDGSVLLHEVLALLQAASKGPGRPAGARDDGGGGGDGGTQAEEVPAGAAAGAGAGAAADKRQQQQQLEALRPLVGRCVDLMAGLLAHSEACRAAVGASALASEASTADRHGSALASSSSLALPLQQDGRCAADLHRAGLPYILAPRAGGGSGGGSGAAAVGGAAAARALRHRQLRSFVYGSDSGGNGGFDPGGAAAVDADGVCRSVGQLAAPRAASSGASRCESPGESGSLGEVVQLLLDLAESYGDEPDAAPAAAASAATARPAADLLTCIAAALSAVGIALPAMSRRQALLPALSDSPVLLVPLLSRPAVPPRVAATALLHTLLECPACVSEAAAALGVPGYRSRATHSPRPADPTAHERMDVDDDAEAGAVPSYNDPMDPTAAVQLATALLDSLELEEWGEGPGGGSSSSGGDGTGGSIVWGPYELPRRVLALLAMLLDTGHEALLAAMCCPPWLEGYGLPQRLLALADAACSAPGSDAPLEPVYPAPANPSLQIVAGPCVAAAEWLQRLRVSQEALLLLKELLTGGSEEMRRAALHDLTFTLADSDSQQLVELATARLGAWPRAPPELLEAALGATSGMIPGELAPWAARLALGASTAAGRVPAGFAAGRSGSGVACSVEAVGALAGSVRRRWQHGLQQQQQWQQQQRQQAWQQDRRQQG